MNGENSLVGASTRKHETAKVIRFPRRLVNCPGCKVLYRPAPVGGCPDCLEWTAKWIELQKNREALR